MALIIGGVACLLAAAYWLMEVKRREFRWLVILGQTALMLYFVHQLIALTLINQALGMRFEQLAALHRGEPRAARPPRPHGHRLARDQNGRGVKARSCPPFGRCLEGGAGLRKVKTIPR